MISFDDISPASDNVTFKMFGMHPDWITLFAGNEVNIAWPLLLAVRDRMKGPQYDLDAVKGFFSEAYAEAIQRDFFDKKLRKLGYGSIEEFRKEGRSDLGDQFFELTRELDKAEIGAQFIVCGFDSKKSPRLFEVDSPGYAKSCELLRYAVIGSGYHMAMSSLRRKPLDLSLPSIVYRLMEAKFSSETASGVGERTTVILKARNGHIVFDDNTVERIREIWKGISQSPDPPEAIKLLESKLASSTGT
jgi:hypothetical protein